MTFKERQLEENYGGDYGNSNRNKYLTGALGGAGVTAGAHIMGGSKLGEGILDSAKDYYQKNDVWNNVLQKGKDGLDWLKTDASTTGTSNSVGPKIDSIVDSISN